jgi:adenosylmethionine-8-amino-7-oxononanoate aminotransferase
MSTLPGSESAKLRNAGYLWHGRAHPAPDKSPERLLIVSAEDVYIRDSHGRRFLDSVSGGWNVNLGYSANPIKEAMARQLKELPYFSSFRNLSNEPAEELARVLIEEWFAPEDMTRVYLTTGGADSIEVSLMIARQYWKVVGAPNRFKFLALERSYHGSHFGAASVSGIAGGRTAFEPLVPGCHFVTAPDMHRNPFDESDPERVTEICCRLLETEILTQGPDSVATFIAEPVMAAGGMIVPPASYWPRLREICDRYGILLIADEVVTGFGRTGFECGCRGWGVKPDIMAFAKPITGGYFPLGAVLLNRRIADAFERSPLEAGTFDHGYTYGGHPVGCAAAIAALDMMRKQRVWENARIRGEGLLDGLRKLKRKHRFIGDVRAKGLMAGVEIVAADNQTPMDGQTMRRILDRGLEAGVMFRARNSVVLMLPPLIIDDLQVEEILNALDAGLASI